MSKILGLYMAAGNSKRLGENKLLLELNKVPLGSIALMTALNSDLNRTIVVTSEADSLKWIHPSLLSEPFLKKWLHCSCCESGKGQAFSLKCGVNKAVSLNADGVVILLADQPLITQETINHLISSSRLFPSSDFIATSFQSITMPPILFTKRMFPSLLQLKGDIGARDLLANKLYKGRLVQYEDSSYFLDVDTKEDYNHLTSFYKKRINEITNSFH